MPDPLTLTLVATTVVTEGIKFLYGQAAEVIKKWRENKADPSKPEIVSVQIVPPAIFEGSLGPLVIHGSQLEVLEQPLLQLRKELGDYADGLLTVDMSNKALLETVDALRQALEAVYQQRLTFKGEQRPPSGPVVEGVIDAKVIAGTVAGVQARLIKGGKVTGKVVTHEVKPGGSATGVKVDEIG